MNYTATVVALNGPANVTELPFNDRPFAGETVYWQGQAWMVLTVRKNFTETAP